MAINTDKNYVHIQLAQSNIWVVSHQLGKYPSVSIVNDAGFKIYGSVEYIDTSIIEITFSEPVSGKAFCN